MNSSTAASVCIRKVTAADKEEWLRLRHMLWPNLTKERLLADRDALIELADCAPIFVAALNDGSLCGMAEFSLRQVAAGCESSPIAYVDGWYVDDEWRGEGIGRMLIEKGEAWALGQGCTEMASDTTSKYPGSTEAHAALGFEPVGPSINFRKWLRAVQAIPSESGLI
ncbi:MAG: GNAT family N-acetyltransferase [Verrucomicrobiota bacterium]|nr:GNAT family N-acetyltransferase [Verrucomicrobiota bacterium]